MGYSDDVDHCSDEELIIRIQRRDDKAFEQLYNRYASRVLGLIRRVIFDANESEDVLQIVFMSIWQKCHQYERERGSVQAFIFQIAKTRTIDYMRSHRHHDDVLVDMEEEDRQPDPIELDQVSHVVVDDLLKALSADERRALELTVYGGFTQQEIAKLLHKPPGTVKSWIRRGLIKLKRIVSETANDGGEGEKWHI